MATREEEARQQPDPFSFGDALERRRRRREVPEEDPTSFTSALESRRGRGAPPGEGEEAFDAGAAAEDLELEERFRPPDLEAAERGVFERISGALREAGERGFELESRNVSPPEERRPGPTRQERLEGVEDRMLGPRRGDRGIFTPGAMSRGAVERAMERGEEQLEGELGFPLAHDRHGAEARALEEEFNRELRRQGRGDEVPDDEDRQFQFTPGGSLVDVDRGEVVSYAPGTERPPLQRQETEPEPGPDIYPMDQAHAPSEELRRRRGRYEPGAFGIGSRDVSRSIGRNLGEAGYATGIGTLELLKMGAGIERERQGIEAGIEDLRASREEMRDFFGTAETGAGRAAGMTARFAGELTQFIAPELLLTRIGTLAKNVSTLRRIGREVAIGGPIDAAIAASDRENSMAGFLAEMFEQQAAEGAMMIGPEGEEVPYDDLAREVGEIAETPWKRAVFDSSLGSFMAAGAVPVLDAVGSALGRTRQATPEEGRLIQEEAQIRAVTDEYRQATETQSPLETRPVAADRLEELHPEELRRVQEDLTGELEEARARGMLGLATERDLQRVGRALEGGAAPDAAARARGAPGVERTEPRAGSAPGEGVGGPQRGAESLEGRPGTGPPPEGLEAQRAELEDVMRSRIEELEREAGTDELTGLPNRRGESRALERRPPAEGATRIQLMADLDNFKQVNDRLSQQAGDEYLQDVSDILRDVVREEDAVSLARIGGDEFRVTIDARTGTDPEAMRTRLQERVNEELAARDMDQVEDVPLGMTFFEPGKKTEAKRAAGRSMDRSEFEGDRNPEPVDATPQDARAAARQAVERGDVEQLRRAEAALTEAGDRGRAPAVEAELGPRGEMPSADVFALQRSDIDLDPDRFQYKSEGPQARGEALAGVDEWDYSKAGVMSVWWDPEAERWFVVNGHNRMGLANRTLGEDEPVNVIELHVDSPAEARAMGAAQNIAEGRGTPIDAAKFFRDSGFDLEDLEELNIPLTEAKVQKGIALARLHPAIFQDVVAGRTKVNRAVIIGNADLPPEQQLAIHTSENINELNQGELEELIRMARGAGSRETTQETLFGEETLRESNLLERVKISRRVRRELKRDRRIFGPLAEQSRAQRIEAKGVGQVDTEEAGEIASEAERFEDVYETLSTRSGPVADILNRHARAVGSGDATMKEAADAAAEEIKTTLRDLIEEGGLARQLEEGAEGAPRAVGRAADEGAQGAGEGVPGGGRAGREAGEQPRDVDVPEDLPRPGETLPDETPEPATEEELASILRDGHGDEADQIASSLKNTRTGRLLDQFQDEIEDAGGLTELARAQLQELASRGEDTSSLLQQAGRLTGRNLAGEMQRNFFEEFDLMSRRSELLEQGRPTDLPGEDDLELFERATQAYRAGEVSEDVARRVTEFEDRRTAGAWTSPEEANEVAEDVAQISLDFSDGTVDGVPTAGQRLARVQEGLQRRAWVDVRGQKLGGAADAHRLLYPFRHPRAERLHFFYLDDQGNVLAHTMETSGSINSVRFAEDIGSKVYRRAQRVGASEVVTAHNHPSGSSTPSPEDVEMVKYLRASMHTADEAQRIRNRMDADFPDQRRPSASSIREEARKRAVSRLNASAPESEVDIRRGYVINHDEISEIRFERPGEAPESSVRTYEVEDFPEGAGADWTEARGRKLNKPSKVARLVGSEGRPGAVDVLYLDNQNRAVALESHSEEFLERSTAAQTIGERARSLAGNKAVIVTHGEKGSQYLRALRLSREVRDSDLDVFVQDVLAVEPGGGYASAADRQSIPTRPPHVDVPEARRIFERALPENEEVAEAAVKLRGSDRWWTGRSHFDALNQVPSDVDPQNLIDGYETTTGRFVDRKEALGLEQEAGADVQFGTSEEIRRSPAQEARQRTEEAVERFGTTEDPFEAGYVTRDGRMLDFSGKQEGGPRGARMIDHREINAVYDQAFDRPVDSIHRFLAEGNISISTHDDLVHVRLASRITGDQLKAIQRAVDAMRGRERHGLAEADRISIDVIDPRSGQVMSHVEVENPRSRATQGHFARALREAQEAGFEVANVRAASRDQPDAGSTPVTDDEVQAPRTYPQTSRADAAPSQNHIREVAIDLKEAEPGAVREAAEEMSELIPPGSRLIPVPSSNGSTEANRVLAEQIAGRTRGEVVDVLDRVPNEESSFRRRRQGEPGLTVDEIRHELKADPGELENAYLVDNVVATGATAQSARRVLGRDVPVLAYAKERNVVQTRMQEIEARRAGGGPGRVSEREARYSTGAPYEPLTRSEGMGLDGMPAEEFGPVWEPGAARLEPEDAAETRTRLLHGTSEVFDQFEPTAAQNMIRSEGAGFFFTTDDDIARAFAMRGSGRNVLRADMLESAARQGRDLGEVGRLLDDPTDLDVMDLRRVALDRLRRGDAVMRRAEDGSLQQVTDPRQIEPSDVETGISWFPQDRQPRVVMAEVPGYVVDLRHTDDWPDDLLRMLEGSDDSWDQALLRRYRKAREGRGRGARGELGDTGAAVPNSPALHRFARENDIGKFLIQDDRLRVGESVYVPQPESVELVDARPIGKEPPTQGQVREEGEAFGQEDMFGGTSPPGGGDQFELRMGGEGAPRGLSAAEERARRTVHELQARVDQEAATPDEMERYTEAVKLLRRNDAVQTDEIIGRARLEGEDAPTDPRQGDIFGPEAGMALPKALRTLALAGAGGTAGALVDEDNPWRGATIGATLGTAASLAPGAWTDVMAGRKHTLRERVDQTLRSASRGEPPGAPTYKGPGEITEEELEEIVNFEKFELDPDGTERLKTEAERVAQMSGVKAPHESVSLDEVRELARQLSLDPSDVLSQTPERMTGAELTALGNIVTDNVEKMVRMTEALNHPALTKEQEDVLLRNLETRQKQNNELLERILRGRSQKGRDLSHLRTISTATRGPDGKMQPEYWYVEAKRLLGDQAFKTEHAAEINRLIDADDVEGLAEYVAGLRRSTFSEKMVTWWKASLMSAPITQERNLTGNTSMQVLEGMKDAPAYVFDRLISLAFDTGLQTKEAPRPGRLARASWEGVKRGAREADRVLRLGKTIRTAREEGLGAGLEEFRTAQVFEGAQRKYDLSRTEVSFNNVFADVFTKTVFRSMLAGDRFFKGISFMRSLDEMARVTAGMEGFERGTQEFGERVETLLRSPTDEMVGHAIHDAEIATFTNRNTLGDIGRNIKRDVPALEAVIPFTNTPANIALRTVDYTPFGMLRSAKNAVDLFKVVSGGIADAQTRTEAMRLQRKLAENLGRNTVGSLGVAALGYWLAQKGLMTGKWPSDRQTQRDWQLRGIQANAIYVPEDAEGAPEEMRGTWNSIENISPWGNIMAFGANLHDVIANPETTGAVDVGAGAATSIVSTVTEQSFLTGLSDALTAINNPERASGDAFRRTVSSFLVPNVVKKVVEGFDPHYRRAEDFGEELGRRLPQGLRKGPLEVPPARNVLGDAIERPGGVAKSLFDPFNQRRDKALDDDVIYELSRLGITVAEPRHEEGESLEAYRQRRRLMGEAVREAVSGLIETQAYQSIPMVAERAIQQNANLRDKMDAEEYARDLQADMLERTIQSTRQGVRRRIEVDRAREQPTGTGGERGGGP